MKQGSGSKKFGRIAPPLLKLKTRNKMELKITKEKVLEAANKCGDAKNILKTLFPECFANNIVFSGNSISIDDCAAIYIDEECTSSEFVGKSFHLDSNFKWEIHEENLGHSLVYKRR